MKNNLKKKQAVFVSTFFAAIVLAGISYCERAVSINDDERTLIEPFPSVISTDSLYSNLYVSNYRIIDVRSAQDFSQGKIPNSVNIPFEVPHSVWTTMVNGLLVEVPGISQLAARLGEHGISKNSQIVLVTSLPTEQNPYALAAPTRVALTLAYAGLKNTAILDGGFDKWVNEGKPVTTEVTAITPVTYPHEDTSGIFVGMDFVQQKLGKVILVDARDAAVYAGSVMEPFANKPGHIPTAISLPAPALYNNDGTFKSKAEIQALVNGSIGNDKTMDIVIYCGVGGYAGTVWFALTRILDYKNVKVYDGSAQEWVLTYDMAM